MNQPKMCPAPHFGHDCRETPPHRSILQHSALIKQIGLAERIDLMAPLSSEGQVGVVPIEQYSKLETNRGTKTINIVVDNREGDSLAEATVKHNVAAWLLYPHTKYYGPVDVATLINPGEVAPPIQWRVPDEEPVSVRFYWEEHVGLKIFHKAVWFDRDSANLGKPWNTLYLRFMTDNLNNKPYELAYGGIAFSTGP